MATTVLTKPSSISTLRGIISEMRRAIPAATATGNTGHSATATITSLRDNATLRYILDQYRSHWATQEQLCKAREEMSHMAGTYLCYLRSTRRHGELHAEYHGRGERSVRDIATMVGFKLPHDPK